MKLIVCLDDNNGMLFNKRRQSSDCLVAERISSLMSGEALWVDAYSVPLFDSQNISLRVDDDFLQKAAAGEWCFIERQDFQEIASSVEEIVIFRWNRRYPSDVCFPEILLSERVLLSTEDFPGNSHEMITMEVYR